MTATISKVEVVIPTLDPVAALIDECECPAEQGMGPSTAMIKAAQEHHLQDSDALWRSSGGPILELRGLAKAAARLAEADALDAWLAAGGDET